MFTFDSQIQYGQKLNPFSTQQIKNEPMLFNCDYSHAWELGGPLTREFLSKLPDELKNDKTILDSRVHMLMKGWFPCIPGYHHDDVPRSRDGDHQPNYDNPEYRSRHALALFNAEVAPTEFALGVSAFPDVEQGQLYYKVWHPMVEEKIAKGELTKVSAPSEQIIFMDDRTWHQGVRAVKDGWRFFIRASWDTHRVATNELRRQVQVYLENPMEGW